jgi:hypothetical protein
MVHTFMVTVGMKARIDAMKNVVGFTSEAEALPCLLKAGLDALEF